MVAAVKFAILGAKDTFVSVRPHYLALSLCMSVLGSYVLDSPAQAGGAEQKPVEMNVMLCDSPEHAIAYALAIDNGAVDDEAKDIVGKAAGREVCDKYIGLASPSEQRTVLQKGISYRVTAYQFIGVGAMKWSAVPQN